MAGAFASSFSTDAQAPTVATVEPLGGAAGVAVGRNIVVGFSEAVDRSSAQGAFALRRAGSTLKLGGAFSWNPDSTVMTFDPWSNLAGNASYAVSVLASVRDSAGNVMAGAFASAFSTDAQGPGVAGISPVAGTTGVAVDANVVVTFSEAVEPASAQGAFSLRPGASAVNLDGLISWDPTSTVMTFDPSANLLANTAYSVSVAPGVRDLGGNAMTVAFASGFVSDAQAPTVAGVEPVGGSTGVSVSRNMIVTFSEPVERGSAQAAFALRPAGATAKLAGAFSWDVTSTVMTFNPTANLLAGAGYTIAVTATVRDLAGIPMTAPVSRGFRT